MGDYMNSYSSQNTAILIVDPFNDFLSEGGKLNIHFSRKVVGAENSILNYCLKKEILLPKTIGQQVDLQIQI